jgi:hypothetical protein
MKKWIARTILGFLVVAVMWATWPVGMVLAGLAFIIIATALLILWCLIHWDG